MTYWAINAVFLTVVAVVTVASIVVVRMRAHSGVRGSSIRWPVIGVTMVVVLIMTAIFDNIMIGVGLVGYDARRISGVFVGIAPLEDFAYAVAAVVLLPALWVLLGYTRMSRGGQRTEGEQTVRGPGSGMQGSGAQGSQRGEHPESVSRESRAS